MKRIWFVVCGLWLLAGRAPAREIGVIEDGSGNREIVEGRGITAKIFDGEREVMSSRLSLEEVRGYIVEFRTPPLTVSGRRAMSAAARERLAAAQERERADFRADLSRLESAHNSRYSERVSSRVRSDYRIALNGSAITTHRLVAEEIKRLPYVKRIGEDREVRALDEESNRLIQADRVWSEMNADGTGTVIAVIDTGIDRTHPAFAGGKVIGGYDFVNNDSDPMDDHGHGTHCAGIAAANCPELKGVAPGASLLAVKVLSASGSGLASWVIAGIEYAVDPDRDPATDDAADVISVSLGGSGDPDDELCAAVDNAAANGVVCAVAAGNSGPKNYTVSSPGCARTAVTVGASSKEDEIASFSSRGPVTSTFEIKPDVLAPGVAIASSIPGGGYASWGGTSMATPHVAGAAALLRQLHPSWTPGEIKAALVETARDIGENVWTQGGGRIDVYEAAKRTAVVTPAVLNLGIVNAQVAVWTKTERLAVRNDSTGPREFSFSAQGEYPGVSYAFQPAGMTVPSGESAEFDFTVAVDNSLLPYDSVTPPSYTGAVLVRSDEGTLNLPFAFLKSRILELTFSEDPWVVNVINRNGREKHHLRHPGEFIRLPVFGGEYDVIVTFQGAERVFRENVAVSEATALSISTADAVHEVRVHAVDAEGREQYLYLPQGMLIITGLDSGFVTAFLGGMGDTFRFSDVSDRYPMDLKLRIFPTGGEGALYEFPFALEDGISASLDLRTDPALFRRVVHRYAADPGVSRVCFMPFFNGPHIGYGYVLLWEDSPYLLREPFEVVAYYHASPSPKYTIEYSHQELTDVSSGWEQDWDNPATFRTACIRAERDGGISFHEGKQPAAWCSATAASVGVDHGRFAPAFTGRMYNAPTKVLLKNDVLQDTGYNFFVTPWGDLRKRAPLAYELRSREGVVEAGMLSNDYGTKYQRVGVDPGAYELSIAFDSYYLAGVPGSARALLEFDTSLPDPNPPYLWRMDILARGRFRDIVDPAEGPAAAFSVFDEGDLSSVSLDLRPFGRGEWLPLVPAADEGRYEAVLPGDLPYGYYSLRIVAADASGNSLTYEAEPAFLCRPAGSGASGLDSGDYDGDGLADIACFQPERARWAIRGIGAFPFGADGDLPVSGDYNGDGQTDPAVYRPSSGMWAVRGITRFYFGAANDQPVPGDYDGDGRCEAAVFRADGGLWAMRGGGRIYLGAVGDQPAPGDYDGDGVKEPAVFRSSGSRWSVWGLTRFHFGAESDQPVVGDYDGDGAWNAGIFRPSTGLWAVRDETRFYFGEAGDRPVPADFDGDAADEAGVFIPSPGRWMVRGITGVNYGSEEDLPATR